LNSVIKSHRIIQFEPGHCYLVYSFSRILRNLVKEPILAQPLGGVVHELLDEVVAEGKVELCENVVPVSVTLKERIVLIAAQNEVEVYPGQLGKHPKESTLIEGEV